MMRTNGVVVGSNYQRLTYLQITARTYLRRVLLVEVQQPCRVLASHIPLGNESAVVPEHNQREGQHQHEGELQAAPELGTRGGDGLSLGLCGAHGPSGGVQPHVQTAALHRLIRDRILLLLQQLGATALLLTELILRRRDTEQWRERLRW